MKTNSKSSAKALNLPKGFKDPKMWALIGIVALTLFVFITQWGPRSNPSSVAPVAKKKETGTELERRSTSKSKTSSKKVDALHSQDPVLMPQLEVEPTSFEQEKRNLFAFFIPPPPPVPPPPEPVCGDHSCNGTENYESCPGDCPPPKPPPVCGDKVCEGGEAFANCPADCDPPPPPEITLKYMGYLIEGDVQVAFLTDGKEVYMGRENDIIANRYKIVKITEESIELGFTSPGTRQTKTIQFAGNDKS